MRFRFLTVIKDAGRNKFGERQWLCRCDFGLDTMGYQSSMLSCKKNACIRCTHKRRAISKTKHGESRKKREHYLWIQMKQRCTNPKLDSYKNYGGRGIKVCDRWKTFLNFICDMGRCPFGYTLERIDSNKDYCPDNCKWATRKEQARNTRRNRFVIFNGARKTVAQWSEESGLGYACLYGRMTGGWHLNGTFLNPSRNHHESIRP